MTLPAGFSDLLRPELENLVAYVPHSVPGIVAKLDANEAPPTRSPVVKEVVARALAGVALERYPDPQALRLKEAIAKRTGAKPSDLLVGSGSDEVIALIVNALARPRERTPQATVLMPTPTFVMYRLSVRAHGLKPIEVPLDAAWDIDPLMMKRAMELMKPNLVFVASPNNPTGNRMNDAKMLETIAAASSSFFVLDEAYVDYAGESRRGWREEHAHLGVLRTLSKVGLAALRIGWLEADAALIAEIDKTRQPFNVSALAQTAAAAVLEEAWDAITADVAEVRRARDTVTAAIAELPGFVVTPSDANFLWVHSPQGGEHTVSELVKSGVLVRSFHASGGRLGPQIRVTVGTESENDRLVTALRKMVAA